MRVQCVSVQQGARPLGNHANGTIVAIFIAVVLMHASARLSLANAADAPSIKVKVAGKLSVPSSAAIGVIATDPVLQQVLSQDFQVAGRLAGASATSESTLTVTLSHRVLEPGMSLNDVAPGNGEAIALLQQAGVKPLPIVDPPQDQVNDADADGPNAAEGNTDAKNDVHSYAQQGQIDQSPLPLGGPMGLPMTQWPVPPAAAQQRSAIPPYMQTYQHPIAADHAHHDREASSIYDTIFVAHATSGNGDGLTVVAIAHPGFNAHEARKLIAEEIANAVLH